MFDGIDPASDPVAWLASVRWTCHVCHDERPDEAISVHRSQFVTSGGVQFQQNVRYCNDRPSCIAGAPEINFFPRTAHPKRRAQNLSTVT